MPASASSSYAYESFDNPRQQIRLLTIMPNRDKASIIEAKLSMHHLPASNASRFTRLRTYFNLPWYFAVSYVWGEGPALEKTHEIILDGCRFNVTANLHAALHESRSFASYPLRVWIDGICIDQENLNERDGQISIMREIYHLAQSVLVSLGTEVDEGLRMMQFISNLTQHPLMNKFIDLFMRLYVAADSRREAGKSETWLEWALAMIVWKGNALLMYGIMSIVWPLLIILEVSLNISRDDREFKIWPNVTPKFNIEEALRDLKTWVPSDQCLRAVGKENLGEIARLLERNLILESRYFSRIWTFQEGATGLAATIQHGGMLVELENVLKTVYYLNTSQKLHSFDRRTMEKMTSLWMVKKIWRRGIRLSLRELLFHCRFRNCYDDKDVVNALLGLINGRMDPRLQPDKTKSVVEVYADATQFIADTEQCLDIICCLGREERPEDLPSWCPHFRRFGISDVTVPLTDASGRITIFSASLKEPHVPSDIPTTTGHSNRILKVTGLYLGTVQRLSQKTESGETLDLIERKWNTALISGGGFAWKQLKMLSSLSDLLFIYNRIDSAEDTKLNRAEMDDQVKSLIAKLAKPDTRDLLISYLLTLVCGRTAPTARCNADEIMSLLRRACVQDADGKASLSLLCGALKDGVQGRRLAVLEEGPMAAVPADAQVGDGLFVLIGCSVPVCLRRDVGSDKWKLVGECYVNGYMDGKAIRQRDEGRLSVGTLLLI